MSHETFRKFSSRFGERRFALLCTLLGGMGQGVVAPQLPKLLGLRGSLALESGISATVLYLGVFIATFFFGSWADRGKVNRLLSFGLLGYAGTLIAISTGPGLEAFFALRFLEGLSLSAIFIAADFLLGKLSVPEERGRWLSYYGVALSAGLLLGPLLTLVFASSKEDVLVSAPMRGVAALAVISAIWAWTQVRVPREPTGIESELTPHSPRPFRNFGAFGAGATYGAMEASLVAVLPVVAIRQFMMKPELCLIVVIMSAAIASVPWGILSDRMGPRRVVMILLSLLAFGSPVLVSWLLSDPEGAQVGWVSCIFFGVIAGGLYPVAFSWLLESYSASAYGQASGAFTRAYGLGSLAGPAIAGAWVEASGFGGLLGFLTFAGILGLGAVLIPRGRPRLSH